MPVVADVASVAWEPDKLLALALSRPPEALTAAREVLAGHPSPAQAAVAHQAADYLVRFAERHSFFHEIFSEIGGKKRWIIRGSLHSLAINLEFAQHRSEDEPCW